MLRSSQASKNLADTEKVLYELGLAKSADAMTGGDIAKSMGVPPEMIAALAEGGSQVEGMREPGAVGPQPGMPIPQAMVDKFTNSNTLKALQALSGGTGSCATAQTLMNTLLGGQELGTRSNMQAGLQDPVDVAAMEAALLGKDPGGMGTGAGAGGGGAGGKSPASKVQEVNHLMTLGIPKEIAIDAVHGNPKARTYADVYSKVFAQTFSPKQAHKAAQNAADQYQSGYEPGPAANDPLGLR